MKEGFFTTVDVDAELEVPSANTWQRRDWKESGPPHRRSAEDHSNLDETWDLVYIDGRQAQLPDYYKWCSTRETGGIYPCRQCLMGWQGAGSRYTKPGYPWIIDFNDFVMKDERVENLLLPFRDGVMIIRKKVSCFAVDDSVSFFYLPIVFESTFS